jgi:hypothetical protein
MKRYTGGIDSAEIFIFFDLPLQLNGIGVYEIEHSFFDKKPYLSKLNAPTQQLTSEERMHELDKARQALPSLKQRDFDEFTKLAWQDAYRINLSNEKNSLVSIQFLRDDNDLGDWHAGCNGTNDAPLHGGQGE